MDETKRLRLLAQARQRVLALQAAGPQLDLRPQAGESREAYRARIEAARGQETLSPETQAANAQAGAALQANMRDDRDPALVNAMRAVRQGATLGFGDELTAGLVALSPNWTYEQALDNERRRSSQFSEDHPIVSAGLEIAGAIPTSMALASAALPSMVGAGMGKNMLAGGLLGAGEGAVSGFGSGEGGLLPRAKNALASGGIGLGIGGVAPAAIGFGQAALRPVAGMVRNVLGIGSESRAANALARTMSRAGMDEQAVVNALSGARADGQDMFTVADALGNPGQRALAGVARSPGEGRTMAQEFLLDRQLGQADRMGGYVSDALDLSSNTAAQVRAEQAARRSGDARINYPAADAAAGRVDLSGIIDQLDQRLAPYDQGQIRPTDIARTLQQYRSMLEMPESALPQGANRAFLSDYGSVLDVKQQLGDAVEAAHRAGNDALAAELRNLRDGLDGALESASSLYRTANDTYRAQSQVIDAIDRGQQVARGQVRTSDALASIPPRQQPAPSNNGLVPQGQGPQLSPRDAFRVGYGDQMLVRPENMTPTSNATLAFRTPRQQAMMSEMATDPDLWQRRLQREITMAETRGAATGGSMTADNIADQADVTEGVSLVANIATGNAPAVLRQIGQRIANAATGMDENTRRVLAQALLSRDPANELQRLFAAAKTSAERSQITEAIMRHGGYQLLGNQ